MADEAAGPGTDGVLQHRAVPRQDQGLRQTRGHVPVYPGDVLVIDEATQVSTEDALRITQAARQCGAMVVATFDPEQLGSVDAGGSSA